MAALRRLIRVFMKCCFAFNFNNFFLSQLDDLELSQKDFFPSLSDPKAPNPPVIVLLSIKVTVTVPKIY